MPGRVAFVDGPPGAGKTTVLNTLAAKYKLVVIPEPVDRWAETLTTLAQLEQTILETLQNEDVPIQMLTTLTQYELTLVQFQTMVLCWYQELEQKLPQLLAARNTNAVIIERSPVSAMVFHALASADDSRSTECVAQLDLIAKQLPTVTDAIYFDLRVPPPIASARLAERNAPGDSRWSEESLELYYTKFDEIMHQQEIAPIQVDAEQSPEEVATTIYKTIIPSRSRRLLRELFF